MSANFLQNAQNVSINNAQFVNNPQTFNYNLSTGLHILLKASLPEAAHDSSARHPPPRCHPGTRKNYVAKILYWSQHSEDRTGRMLWMYGPAGVGKSAVAQTCAEALANLLGAAFFFSRINSRNDPNCFFTTISYQLAIKFPPYGDILDKRISRDPTLVTKAIDQQFAALIVAPLRELKEQGHDIGELVVIVDGIDECTTAEAQCEILGIIARSVQEQSTPLLWLFFSRPEAHITATFTSPYISPISFHIELPVSRDIDIEITLYLTDELGKIRREHNLPASWPSEADIGTLVNLCAGLFIYAATIIRFIGAQDSLGPEDQLAAVLNLATKSTDAHSAHPLSELDALYTLIIQRVPPQVLPITQKILILTSIDFGGNSRKVANALNLSESQYWHACRNLFSVLKLAHEDEEISRDSGRKEPLLWLTFYHASFMEFMWNQGRSGKYCLRAECAVTLRRKLLKQLNKVHDESDVPPSSDTPRIQLEMTWKGEEEDVVYSSLVRAFLILCQTIPLDPGMSKALDDFNYSIIPRLLPENTIRIRHLEEPKSEQILNNLPKRPFRKMFLFNLGLAERFDLASWDFPPYVLGIGKNKVLCWHIDGDALQRDAALIEYPRFRDIIRRKFKMKKKTHELDESGNSSAGN